MELYNGQLKKQKLNIYSNKKSFNNNDILTFDIETTSYWIEDGNPIPYQRNRKNREPTIVKRKDERYLDYEFDWNSLESGALCYIWQFSFNDKVYYGRELRSFVDLLNDLPNHVNFIIWVHNLSFEFQFLLNIFIFDEVFARSPHRPIKCKPQGFKNIEFRCSYILTRLSLANWGKKCGVLKKEGQLDYDKLRTPLTPMEDKELEYCEYDCLVMYKGLQEYRQKYGTIHNIPLTQTGTVRRVIKDLLVSDFKYLQFVKRLVPKDADEYYILQRIFAGGYTHANRFHSMRVHKGLIEHYDFTSSYPFVILTEKFPCNPWSYAKNEIPSDSVFEDYAYIFHLRFTELECLTFNTYIQAGKSVIKTIKKKPLYDNGRVVNADELEIWITEQDWLTIKETYKWKNLEVIDVKKSRKKYLDRKFLMYILELYGNKTSLKDVDGKEALYAQSKEYINSLFGMMVTAIMQADVSFNADEWSVGTLTEEMVNDHLKKLSAWGSHESRYFLSYSWGCWVTAYARRNLWKCLIPNDEESLYCDTDAIFLLGKNNFDWYNEIVRNKIMKSAEENNIPFDLFQPKTKKGERKMIGIFAKEDDCSEFITLGAKRYVERRIKDNKLHLTVSGINKEAVAILEDDIENFKDGIDFNKDSEHVKKKILMYTDNQSPITFPDGYQQSYSFGINMRNNGYKLSVTDEYDDLIQYTNFSIENQREEIMTRNRGVFIPNSLVN